MKLLNLQKKTRQVVNILLLCLTVFATGLSLSILAPFYPSEAIERNISVTLSGNSNGIIKDCKED